MNKKIGTVFAVPIFFAEEKKVLDKLYQLYIITYIQLKGAVT